MSDYQAKRLYKYEKEVGLWENRTQMDKADVLTLVREACDLFGVDMPEVKIDGRLRKYSYQTTRFRPAGESMGFVVVESFIKLAKSWGCSRFIVLHEVSHHIVEWTFGHGVELHGAEFVAVASCLYAHFLQRDLEELIREATCRGLGIRMDIVRKMSGMKFLEYGSGKVDNSSIWL